MFFLEMRRHRPPWSPPSLPPDCCSFSLLTPLALLNMVCWLSLCINLTGLRDAQIAGNTFLGVSVRVFEEETSIWFRRLNKDLPHWHGRTPSNPLKAWTEENSKGRANSLAHFLSWDVHHLLPSGIRTPVSWVFARLTPVDAWFPGLQSQAGSPTHGSPMSHTFGLRRNCTSSFPGSPACRWQVMSLLSFHNCVRQFL